MNKINGNTNGEATATDYVTQCIIDKIEKVDFIISTIPFVIIDKRKRKRIIARPFTLLKEKGKFITTQQPWLIYNMIKEQSSEISIKPSILNMPPAFVLEGIK